jgi:hypothetical protein
LFPVLAHEGQPGHGRTARFGDDDDQADGISRIVDGTGPSPKQGHRRETIGGLIGKKKLADRDSSIGVCDFFILPLLKNNFYKYTLR